MPATGTGMTTGSAQRWGPLWGARPADWALCEDQQTPTYEAALDRLDLQPGRAVLDVGCGVGAFLRLVTERGARAFGIDASQALIDLARLRLPAADLPRNREHNSVFVGHLEPARPVQLFNHVV